MRVLFSKLGAMFRRRFLDQEFDAEVETHLEMLFEENISRGMTPEEARPAALRSLGNVTRVKESQRESRGLPQIETLFADLKYGARMLCANPGFTLIAALTLALGVGVVTTVFTAYNEVALKPLPVADPSQVVRLERWFADGGHGDIQYGFSFPEYLYCRDRNDVFTGLVAATGSHTVVAGDGEKLGGQLVTANYFTDLGVPAQIGRTFLPDEDRTPGGNPVIVLSNTFWERRFHSDREVTGRIVKLNGIAFTVVGVAAKEFSGTAVIPQPPDFWAPVSMQAQLAPGRDWLNAADDQQFQILARIKPGVGARRAEAETAGLIRQFAGTYEEEHRTTTVTLQRTSLLGNTEDVRFQASALAIMLIVGMVLLVGCVNIANMLLARGAARQKEISVRLALGASRGRVIRQLLTENLLLSVIGGAGGLLLSIWTSKMLWIALEQFLQKTSKGLGFDLAVGIDLSPDWRVLAYAMVLSLFAGLLFGLSPALQFSRPDLTTALKTDGGFGAGWSRSRLRSLLVATQVTVSMMLLISSGLLMRGLSRAQVAEPGYETQSVYSVFGDFGPDPVKAAALEQRLRGRFENLPEVRNVAQGTTPLMGTWTIPIMAGTELARTLASSASDTYFDLFGIPIVRGRHFTRLESEQAQTLAIVSEATARKVAAIRAAAGAIDPRLQAGLSMMNLEAGPVQMQRSFAQISALFAAILAALALALAGVGIYGVMSYLVSRSIKEIGVRVALGAKAGDVLLSVVVRGLRPVFCGLALGVAGAAALSALLHSTLALPGSPDFFYGVPFYDPATFLGLSAFLIVVAGIASAIPARRALSVDPIIALRFE